MDNLINVLSLHQYNKLNTQQKKTIISAGKITSSFHHHTDSLKHNKESTSTEWILPRMHIEPSVQN